MGSTSVLLISEATLLAVVALAAIVVVAMVVLALVVLSPHAPAPSPPAPAAHTFSLPMPSPPVPRAAQPRVVSGGRSLEIDVPTQHVDEFIHALRSSGWRVHETGEVVATDEDEEGLTTVMVDLPHAPQRTPSGEEIH